MPAATGPLILSRPTYKEYHLADDFGVPFDALTDGAAKLAAAITAVTPSVLTGQALVRLIAPPGWCIVSSGPMPPLPAGIQIEGAGPEATCFIFQDTGHDFLVTQAGDAGHSAANIGLRGFAVSGPGMGLPTSGAFIRCTGSDAATGAVGVWITDVGLQLGYQGIVLDGSQVRQVWIDRCPISSMVADGIFISVQGDVHIDHCFMGSNARSGLTVVNAGALNGAPLQVSNTNIDACGCGVRLIPGSTQQVLGARFNSVSVTDSSGHGWYLAAAAGGIIADLGIANSRAVNGTAASGQNGRGVILTGQGSISGVTFDGFSAHKNPGEGISIASTASDIALLGFQAAGNGWGTGGPWDGAYVAPGVQGFRCVGGRFGPVAYIAAGNSGWGINIDNGGTDYYVVQGNDTHGNTLGGLRDAGTGSHKAVTGNI